jgi:hypothetical protein
VRDAAGGLRGGQAGCRDGGGRKYHFIIELEHSHLIYRVRGAFGDPLGVESTGAVRGVIPPQRVGEPASAFVRAAGPGRFNADATSQMNML